MKKIRKTKWERVHKWNKTRGKLKSLSVSANDFYYKNIKNENVLFLYEFIYGNRAHEFDILMRGFDRMFERAKKAEEKAIALKMKELAFSAWTQEKKDRARRFKYWACEPADAVVNRAKNGDDTALFALIAFDKRRISESFVLERISRAQAEKDRRFFQRLSGAVRQTSGLLEGKRGKQAEAQDNKYKLFRMMRILGFDFDQEGVGRKLKDILNELSEEGKNLPIEEPSHTIKRTIKRMGLKA